MKKLFLISLLVCVGILQSFAFEYNDERGVTWSCDPIDNTSVRISSASGYDYLVVIPEKVYCGTEEYTVTEITFTFQGRNRQTLWGGCTDANPKLLLNDT